MPDDDLGLIEGEASDDDPEVVQRMERLTGLRAHAGEIPEIGPRD